MLKKLLIASAAVVIGLVILKKTDFGSLVQVWWKDTGCWASRQVSPETRIKQLKHEITKIDHDVKTAINNLVRQEASFKMLKDEVDSLRTVQDQRRKDLLVLVDLVEKGPTEVLFKKQTYTPDEAQSQLDYLRTSFETGKEALKAKDQLLKIKAKQLEVADQRIFKIQEKKTELTNLVAKMEAQLELIRLKQVENNTIEVNDSQVNKCIVLQDNLKRMLIEEEARAEKYARFGLTPSKQAPVKDDRSRTDSINAAKAALADEVK